MKKRDKQRDRDSKGKGSDAAGTTAKTRGGYHDERCVTYLFLNELLTDEHPQTQAQCAWDDTAARHDASVHSAQSKLESVPTSALLHVLHSTKNQAHGTLDDTKFRYTDVKRVAADK